MVALVAGLVIPSRDLLPTINSRLNFHQSHESPAEAASSRIAKTICDACNALIGFYLSLNAVPDSKSAMLYSLGAMTGFGAGTISLPAHWQMMGVLQSLAGLLLFGLSTAFMFAMFQAVWPSQQQADDRGATTR